MPSKPGRRCWPSSTNHVVSHAGQWTLGESALAIQHADAVVSGDTVTMHLAAAVGTPLASVWGCTRPSLGLSAWRPHPQSLDLTPGQSRTTLFQTRCHLPTHALVRPISSGPLRPTGFGGRFGGVDARGAEVTPCLAVRPNRFRSIEQGFELCGVFRLELARQNQPELPATQCAVKTHPL